MKPRHLIAVCLFGAASCAASAENLKPGLWEINSKMSSSSGEMEKAMAEMQKQMAAMPPDQRKMMQDMMAKQGVGMGGNPGSGIKMCMTKEMVERNDFGAQKGNCKNTSSGRSGNTMKMSFVCTDPASSGEGQVTFNGPESYTSKMTIHSAGPQGKPETTVVNSSGKWLSADCGNIKPINPPK